MMKSKIVVLVLMVLMQRPGFGQRIGREIIDDSKMRPWITESVSEYQSVYHFGESESESYLILLFGNDTWYAQFKFGSFSDDGSSWIWNYKNLSNVRIEGNKFISDETKGKFIIYENGKEKVIGLNVTTSPAGFAENGGYEIGRKSHSVTEQYAGKYPQASFRPLRKDELSKMSKQELKIIRNEIFARYGYTFKTGGQMESYFKKQDWYSAHYANVNTFLTGLEKENIKLLHRIENE